MSKRTPSRRAILGTLAASPLVALPALASASDPDAEVTALCAELTRLEGWFLGLFDGPGRIDDDDARDVVVARINALREPLLLRLCTIECRGDAAIVAKLRLMALLGQSWAADWAAVPPDCPYEHDRLLGSVFRDVRRGSA